MRRGEVKKGRYFLKGDDRGASLIAVLVVLAFVVTMGTVIMSGTVANIRMREVEQSGKKNFYNADAVMDGLKREMAGVAAKEMQKAYTEILASYDTILEEYNVMCESYDPTSGGVLPELGQVLQDKFKRKYLDNLETYFVDTIITNGENFNVGQYDSEKVAALILEMGFEKDEEGASDPDDPANPAESESDKAVFKNDDEDKVVLNIDGEKLKFTTEYGEEYEEGFFTLKNLMVEFQDKGGYATLITADLAFGTPAVQFDIGTAASFMEYALIADSQIKINNTSDNTVTGSVYAGAGGIVGEGTIGDGSPTAKATFSGDNIVTRGDIVAKNSASLTFGLDPEDDDFEGTTHIWAQNLRTKGESKLGKNAADPWNLEINGEIYVEDDLALNGANSKVKLSGYYNGYNYQDNYNVDPTTLYKKESQYSSAIMINGEGCILDLTGLDRMFLAGKTFIPLGSTAVNQDIRMAESLSVRADQIAYLVSEKYVEPIMDGSNNITGYSLKKDKYEQYTGVDVNTFSYTVKPYFDRGPSEDPSLFYLVFSDEDEAEEFFSEYKEGTNSKRKGVLNKYEGYFADEILLDKDNIIVTASGYLLNGDNEEDGDGFGLHQAAINDSQLDDANDIYWERADILSRTYKSLQDDLTGVYTRVTPNNVRFTDKDGDGKPDKEEASLFDNLIDQKEAELTDRIVSIKSSGESGVSSYDDRVEISSSDASKSWKVVICDGGYKVEGSSFIGIVIAAGDVEITATKVEGMVISGGTITFSSDSATTVEDNADLVKSIFDEIDGKPYGSEFTAIFKTYKPYDTDGADSARIGDYLFYENWTKNEE